MKSQSTERCVLSTVRSLPYGQKGYATGYIILFIIVIIFAVMLTGGGGFLFSGDEPSPDYTDDVSPSPTASPSASAVWNLEYTLGNCGTTNNVVQKIGKVKAKGVLDGYFQAFIEGPNNTFIPQGSPKEFVAPESSYDIFLSNALGFNTKKWRIELYSGGGTSRTDGKMETRKDGDATGC